MRARAEGIYTRALDGVFGVYRRVLSPVFAGSGLGQCRYLPSCSEYAQVALARHGLLRGAVLAAGRLGRCHPWAKGGLDPVPPATDQPCRPRGLQENENGR